MNYFKIITANGSGTVTAQVFDDSGRLCGQEYWMYRAFFETNSAPEKRLKRANDWADKRMNILSRLEKHPKDEAARSGGGGEHGR